MCSARVSLTGLHESTQPTLLSPGFPTWSAITVEATCIASMLSYTLHAPDHEGMDVCLCCGNLTGANRWEATVRQSPPSTLQTARGCGWSVVPSATRGSAGLSKAPSSLANAVRQKHAESLSPPSHVFCAVKPFITEKHSMQEQRQIINKNQASNHKTTNSSKTELNGEFKFGLVVSKSPQRRVL